jgi:hypothetical protein
MKELYLLSTVSLMICGCTDAEEEDSTFMAGPGITIDIEPYPIGEINIPEPGGLACRLYSC